MILKLAPVILKITDEFNRFRWLQEKYYMIQFECEFNTVPNIDSLAEAFYRQNTNEVKQWLKENDACVQEAKQRKRL